MDKSVNASNGENFAFDFQRNMLDSYDSPTYHFRLFMAPESLTLGRKMGDPSQQVTIAESGVTGIGIDSVNMMHVHGYSAEVNGSGTALTYNIKLKEPFNAVLFDKMYAASQVLGIRNYHKCPYFLELTFIGNAQNGRPEVIGNQKWVFPLAIIKISTNLTASGTEYDIEAVKYGDLATSDQVSVSFSNITVSSIGADLNGLSIERALSKLGTLLTNKQQLTKKVIPDEFIIKIDKNCSLFGADGGVYTYDVKKDLTESDRQEDLHFSDGTSIERMIDSILACSKILQEKAKPADVRTQNDVGADDEKIIVKSLYKIHPDVELLEYDYVRGDYARRYTYTITDYGLSTVIASQDEPSMTPTIADKAFQHFLQKGKLKKHYNYLYTGQNTDINNFDLNFNMAWYVSLPRNDGDDGGFTSSDTGKKAVYNDSGQFTPKPTGIQLVNERIEAITTVPLINSTPVESITQEQPSIPLVTEEERRKNQIIANSKAENKRLNEEAIISSQLLQEYKKQYVEDFTDYTEIITDVNSNRKHPISFITDPIDKEHSTSGDNYAVDEGRIFLSSLFAQANKTTNSDLLQGTFEIKGDPFWLQPPMSMGDDTIISEDMRIEKQYLEYGPENKHAGLYLTENFFLFTTFTANEDLVFTEKLENDYKNVLNGVYGVIKSEHSFSSGKFTQKLFATRHVLSDLNYVQIEKYIFGKSQESVDKEQNDTLEYNKSKMMEKEEFRLNKQLTSELRKGANADQAKIKQIEKQLGYDTGNTGILSDTTNPRTSKEG